MIFLIQISKEKKVPKLTNPAEVVNDVILEEDHK